MNIHVMISEQQAGMTIKEFQEYHSLNKQLFGDAKFVEPDWSDPRWARHNELSAKYQAYLYKTKHFSFF